MKDLTQKEKAEIFLKLHHADEVLVLLNSWDPGSSMLIQACGFKAIATTSMGISASLGYPDRQAIPFTEMLGAIKRIVDKVTLPVTVDIEGGYGQDPKEILNYIEEVIKTGIVGINIEDSKNTSPELIDENEFGERITAIRQLSDSLGIHLVINARTDVFLAQSGAPESRLSESIKRGNKYILAGADCIFVPNVWETDKIAVLTLEINGPVNILANPTNGTEMPPSVSELKKLGVARLSVGSALMKSTLALIKKTADEVIQSGTYNNFTSSLMPIEETVDAYNMAVGITKP